MFSISKCIFQIKLRTQNTFSSRSYSLPGQLVLDVQRRLRDELDWSIVCVAVVAALIDHQGGY